MYSLGVQIASRLFYCFGLFASVYYTFGFFRILAVVLGCPILLGGIAENRRI